MVVGRPSTSPGQPRALLRVAALGAALVLLGTAGATSLKASSSSGSGAPVSAAPPTLAGLARAGETLTATPGSWSGTEPISYAYEWLRCGPGYAQVVAARGPVGYWRLGESSGAAAVDASARGHHGSYSGAYALAQAGAIALDADTGVRLGAGSSSGTMSVSHRGTLNTADAVTYELWMRLLRLPTSSSGADVVTKGSNTLLLRLLPSGVLTLRRSGGSELTRSTAALAVDGAYHHVAAVKAGPAVRIYVDGVDVTGPVSNSTLSNSSSSLTLRASGLEAVVDEFALYSRGLSATEVAAGYAAGRDGGCKAVAGANAASYALDAADVGSAMRVQVTASNALGTATALSAPTATVTPPSPPVNTAPPALEGVARAGQTLTAAPGSWDGTQPIDISYGWERCDAGYAALVSARSPLGYWRLGETSGTNASDVSGRGHHGGYGGSYTLGRAGALALDGDAAVRLGGSSSGSMSVPHRSSLSYGNAATYEAWVKVLRLPTSSSGADLVTKGSGTLVLRLLPTGEVSLRKAGSSQLTRSTVALPVDGAYHHVVGVKASSVVRIYIDGVDVTGSVSNDSLSTSSSALTLVANGMELHVDEFALYGRGLTAAEVTAAYAAGREGVCAAVPGAAGNTYRLGTDDVGRALRVAVTASNVAGSASARSEATGAVAPAEPPANTAPPSLSGVARVGERLTATSGSWTGSNPISYAYEWRRCDAAGGACTAIADATGTSYELADADVGRTVRVAVTASNAGGSATAVSAASAAVAAALRAPTNEAPPEVSGSATVGATLTGSPGTWSGTEPISYAYQWRRCSSAYAGLVQDAGAIAYWRLGETAGSTAIDSSGLENEGGYSGTFALAQPGALALDSNHGVRVGWATPSGTVVVGHRASLNVADSVTYEAWVQLLRLPAASSVGANIATKSVGSLVLRILPSGILSLRKSGGGELTRSTVPLVSGGGYQHVVAVKAGADVRVYIDGADVTGPVTNQTLTNNTTNLTIAGNSTAENRDGIDGYLDEFALYGRALSPGEVAAHYEAGGEGECAAIDGATGETYVVGSADAGSALQVRVTATNVAGSASAESAPTELVAITSGAPQSTAAPTVAGILQAGETLTARTGEWTGAAPLSYAYQWRRCEPAGGGCTDIAGAAGSDYVLAPEDMGALMRVAVTASNVEGTATAVSAPTATVAFGYAGPSSLGAGERPTASKPQSKLWWNDGAWWVSMWSPASNSHSIFRLNLATQTWIDTGTPIDSRPGTRADTLWDGTRLYVASHVYATCGCSTPDFDQPSRLYRYSYDAATKTYSLDSGFPVAINNTHSETLVIDKDSTGALWATWAQSNQVYVNRTLGDDRTWGTPFVLPFQAAQSLTADDVSSVVRFGGDRVGVMWSNQNANTMYFSIHRDADPAGTWQEPEIALTGTKAADDHLNLQAESGGRVLVAMKTARDEQPGSPATDPQMMLLVRTPASGAWTGYVAGTIADDHTRPIMLVDEESRTVHLFATAPTTPGGTIYHKSSGLDTIAFPSGLGTPFIRAAGGSGISLNDATSTKQRVNATTGIAVVASERPGDRYWHNYLELDDAPPPDDPGDTTAPVITGVDVSAGTTSATVTWSSDEPADSRVEYGTTQAYGETRSDPALVTSHTIALSGLACATTYYIRVSSADAAGNRAADGGRTLTTNACAGPPDVVRSDEFDGTALDSRWRVLDPGGSSTVSVSGGRLHISLPAGSPHDLWEGALQAPRVLQGTVDGDFEIEAKLDSAVTQGYQSQGLVAHGDSDDLVRFDVYSDGSETHVFAATFVDGQATIRAQQTIAGGAPVYLRLGRVGSTWTLRHSFTGSSWTTAASFSFALALREFGVFAANPITGVAFTAEVDHFRVISEGQPPPPPPGDTAPPVLSGVAAAAGATTATVTWTTDEPADSRVEYGPTTAYGQTRSGSALVTGHSFGLSGLSCATTYHYRVSSADAAGNRATDADRTFTTGACGPSTGPEIEIWYGDSQRFGDPGFAQRWLNILGQASDPDDLLRIDYRVDGGPRIDLVFEPQFNLRIGAHGDFNIELDRFALSTGQHVVTITAADRLGNESTRAVDVEVVAGLTWPLPYESNWAAGLQRTAQVVDGRWALDGDGVRSIVPGYDRAIAIGDETWTTVDATVPVTVHAFSASSDHAGVGIAAGWRGHEGSASPRGEWPLGALCFYYRHVPNDPYWLYLMQYGSPTFVAVDSRRDWLEPGTQYVFRIRAEPVDAQQSRYSCKVWPAAEAEPADWQVSALLPTRSGSLLLVSDHADVTFGRVRAGTAGQ